MSTSETTPETPGTVTATLTSTTRTTTPGVPPSDTLVTTRHTLRTAAGTDLAYTATAGRVVLREEKYEDGVFHGTEAKAEVFLTASGGLAGSAAPEHAGGRPGG